MNRRKMITGAGAIILVGGLLVGCGNDNEQAQGDTVQAAEQSQENTGANESKEQDGKAAEQYEPEIAQFFADYELPEEGKLPNDDPSLENIKVERFVAYDNGIMFERSNGAMVARKYDKDNVPAEPTPEQTTGVVMGLISEAVEKQHADEEAEGVDKIVNLLTEAKELNDFAPLDEWLSARIEGYEKASAMEDGQERTDALTIENSEMNKMVKVIEGE